MVALRPGDRAPVDGVVVDGTSTVDEAALTGEPLPVKKNKGAEGCRAPLTSSPVRRAPRCRCIRVLTPVTCCVHRGSSGAEIMAGTVNVDGTIMVEAKACGADTAIADVVRIRCLHGFP